MADQGGGPVKAGPPGDGPPGGGATGGGPFGSHVCPVAFCPVGLALTFAEAARPEVVQHLMAAGHEVLLAVKAMVDARVQATEGENGLERITIR